MVAQHGDCPRRGFLFADREGLDAILIDRVGDVEIDRAVRPTANGEMAQSLEHRRAGERLHLRDAIGDSVETQLLQFRQIFGSTQKIVNVGE